MRPSEVMRHLGNFAEGDPEEVKDMSPEEVRAELEAEGVDLEAMKQRLENLFASPYQPLNPIHPSYTQVSEWCRRLQEARDWLSVSDADLPHQSAVELCQTLDEALRHLGVL